MKKRRRNLAYGIAMGLFGVYMFVDRIRNPAVDQFDAFAWLIVGAAMVRISVLENQRDEAREKVMSASAVTMDSSVSKT